MSAKASGTADRSRDLRIAIIGAGPGGLCMGIKLQQAGFENFVLLERRQGVGGTWLQNQYPGCACDIPSHLYSFSFEIKRDWSRPYAPQPEILDYMEKLAEKYELLPHCRFGVEVKGAHWDDERALWTLDLASGDPVEAEVVISALGVFNELAWPDIEGLDCFAGTAFHSARWDGSHDLTGETVGVIGSAASAVQLVPEIVKTAGQIHLFQRTANWVLPKEDDPYDEEQLAHFRSDPQAAAAVRDEIYQQIDGGMTFSDPAILALVEAAGLAVIEAVEDAAVREKLRPDHPWGCKRPLYSNDYYAAFNRPNLELVTDTIERIVPEGIVTGDGRTRPVDTLILATGFSATKFASVIDIRGRAGLRINDAWKDGAVAYLGVTTAGFPNLFMLYGPNTNNGSILTMIESQVDYALRQIERIANERLAWLDVRPEAMEHYNEEIQRAIEGVSVWNAGCSGYYRSPSGRVVTQWPHSMSEYHERASKPDPEVYDVAPFES
jgi:cation diffusion facilitator CzcD-associated flavoprotein CzcO